MYGIEDASGNVDVWNSGELFGAIDVALFVLIIGGFLGVTMKTGAINAGIAWVVSKLKGKEKWTASWCWPSVSSRRNWS